MLTTPANLDLVVLTYNEEANLEHCLRSVAGLARNIFVVDSGSVDATVEIARRHGARVVTRAFTNQAEQFNWALDNLPLQSEWVLRLDADEYLSPELRDEIAATLPALPDGVAGLYLKRRMIFLGRWIRHGGYYPTWLLRVFRSGKARSELAEMDEHIVLLEGESRRLRHDFSDHNRKGLSAWLVKHEAYASRQVRVLLGGQRAGDTGSVQAKFLGSQAERKRWLRHRLYARAPLFTRAALYFLYRYFLRLGFLDGLPGLIFHFLHAGWYFFYIDAKVYEGRLNGAAPERLPAGRASGDILQTGSDGAPRHR
jgi:glycosyltransferase involved in cell wall biosynthesis